MHNRNLIWNLAGFGLPMLAAVLAIPPLIALIGLELFALLSIGWLLIGFVGMLDFGVARAITYILAKNESGYSSNQQQLLVNKLSLISFMLGIVWMLLLLWMLPFLVQHLLNIPEPIHDRAESALTWLAFSIPVMLVTNARIAILEGQQRFIKSNLHKIPFGMMVFLLPWWIALIDADIVSIFMGLFALRLVYGLSFVTGIWKRAATRQSLPPRSLQQALVFSSWIAVSNIVSPMLTYFDRFYISALLGLAAVAYYTIPYDMLIRLLVFPSAIMIGLFPVFTRYYAQSDRQGMQSIIEHAHKLLRFIWLPLIAMIVITIKPLLAYWLSDPLSAQMYFIAQLLALGIFINGLATLPYNLLHGIGRSDLVAKLHLFELPLYAVIVWIGITHWGVEGAAVAWAARATLDFILLYAACYRLMPELQSILTRLLQTTVVGFLLCVILMQVTQSIVLMMFLMLLFMMPVIGYYEKIKSVLTQKIKIS